MKFLTLKKEDGRKIKRYQYTAIDDATRVRALKIYQRHNQKSSIDFIDYVVEKFPFRIHTVRTDRGHEWQAQFHWHVEDKGIRHVYIKPRSPQLNGKVERSHRSDQEEFYQLLTYTDDVDLNKKLATWEEFYNLNRPHGAHNCRRCVISAQPEPHLVHSWAKQFRWCRVFKAVYTNDGMSKPKWNRRERTVTVDRTYALNAAYEEIRAGNLWLPSGAKDIDGGDFYAQLKAPTRVRDMTTGELRYRWTEPGALDHYRHAQAFDHLAGWYKGVPGVVGMD